MGANVFVEFENVFLIGGIFFYIWGHFFLSWGQKIILGSRKSAILGIIWTPDPSMFNSFNVMVKTKGGGVNCRKEDKLTHDTREDKKGRLVKEENAQTLLG